jgi:RNA polymerase sigma-70 factor (ECF subfamily)
MFGSSWGSVLGACRLGAEWAWRQVYEDVAPSLLRYHRARGTVDPDDVVGDTFVRAVRGLSGFDGGEGEFHAWLFSISRNRAVELARAASRRPERPAHFQQLVAAGGMGDVEDDALRVLAEERIRDVLTT